jgi:hypothetical protein
VDGGPFKPAFGLSGLLCSVIKAFSHRRTFANGGGPGAPGTPALQKAAKLGLYLYEKYSDSRLGIETSAAKNRNKERPTQAKTGLEWATLRKLKPREKSQ